MSGLVTLLSLCALMATASFIAGVLPLTISLSQSQLRLISAIGMGVLVGTSLIVIIPEGVETLYTSKSVGHIHARQTSQYLHANMAKWPHNERSPLPDRSLPGGFSAANKQFFPAAVAAMPVSEGFEEASEIMTDTINGGDAKDPNDHDEAHHAWIGIALIAGFILMFLIDKVPLYSTGSKARPRTHHIALNNLGSPFNLSPSPGREEEVETFLENNQATNPRNHGFATTTGLVIHAAADGIALGASSSSSNTHLSFVIFIAIMIHKAPAAFGLTSILLRQGISKRLARTHVFVFSIAAPVGALLTWTMANVVGAGVTNNLQNTKWWTGVLLLFSAGTFLYVAMHSMQEITSIHQHGSATEEIAADRVTENRDLAVQEGSKPVMRDLGAAVLGMILPLFLQLGHAH